VQALPAKIARDPSGQLADAALNGAAAQQDFQALRRVRCHEAECLREAVTLMQGWAKAQDRHSGAEALQATDTLH